MSHQGPDSSIAKPPSMPYLVDGNNLAHALGLSNDGLADRESCARTVAAFCGSAGAQATIIFDGPTPERGPATRTTPRTATRTATRTTPRVRVVFGEARSADDLILRLLSDSRTPRDFTVVTSDKSLGDKARHKGATVERAHEFARRLGRSATKRGPLADKPSQRESPEEIDGWLAVFDPQRKR